MSGDDLRSALHALFEWVPDGMPERGVRALLLGLALLALIAAVERGYRLSLRVYRSRAFLHDVAYWFYYRIGLHYLLFLGVLYCALAVLLPEQRPRPLADLPFALQVVLYMLSVDFCVYWIHRAQHAVPFLWAFHSVHHSQTELNFVTSRRFHPLDHLAQDLLMFAPLSLLGFDEAAWLPLYVVGELNAALQHSRIPWTYGPLYRVIVSPVFHRYHHAADPAYHHCNYAGLFSLWDYAFGTAAPLREPLPQRFGVDGVHHARLLDTLIGPFKYLAGRRRAPAAEAPEDVRVRD